VTEPIAAVVSADLPRIAAEDVRTLVAATPDRGMAIARARDGGTNAVSMRPAGAVVTHFGEPRSAAVHASATAAAGLAARILDVPGLAFDVDTPADLEALRRDRA
jgi:2-phospho-L-lactate guanylyltransferase